MPALVYSATRQRATWGAVTDAELLEGLRGGDEMALDELIVRKTRPLVQVAARILGDEEEARDVVQLAFLRLWDHRERYDTRYSPNTWIYRITTNLAIDHLRSRKSREKTHEPVRLQLQRTQDDSYRRDLSQLQNREVGLIFRELAGELSEKQRMVFLLREVEGLSSQEVAEIVGCQESTVRNHLFNARRVLRRELVRRYPEYAPVGFAAAEENP